MPFDDYYKLLGIDRNASPGRIKEAYRELAFAYHPDRNRENPGAPEIMKRVNEAYAVLSNPEKRRAYDRLRQEFGSSAHTRFRQTYTEQDIFSDSDIHQIFEEMSRTFGFRGFEELFKDAARGGRKSFEYRGPGFTAKGFVFFGGFRKFGGKRPALPRAGPLGALLNTLFRQIGAPHAGADLHDAIVLTPGQALQGGPLAYFLKKKSKKLVVNIPPGVREGQKIRLSGMGEDGNPGAAPGDLYLTVRIKKPLLERVKGMLTGLGR